MAAKENEPPARSSADQHDRELLRAERSILARLADAVKLADFMAILMVLATFFSAYATWRTAKLTSTIFAVADRPFIGVQQVAFVGTDAQHPMICGQLQKFRQHPRARYDRQRACRWSMARSSRPPQARCPRWTREFCRQMCSTIFSSSSRRTNTRRSRRENPTCRSTSGCSTKVPPTKCNSATSSVLPTTRASTSSWPPAAATNAAPNVF